jgi:hypothetical protein
MKTTRNYLLGAATLALGAWAMPSVAGQAPATNGLEEIPDAELGSMRGRYTVGADTVAWFGVKMISTWQTGSGQLVQGTLALDMDFSSGKPTPTISFQPSVSITRTDAPLPLPAAGNPLRSIDSRGLANVSGVVQSVQVAGDGNQASNVTRLTVHDGDGALPGSSTATGSASGVASAYGDGASAVASFDGQSANVLLTIEGQGAVQQWIRNGSVGQSVQLTADDQWISNRLEIDLVRQTTAASIQLAQNVAQAINLARGIGLH